MALGDPSKVLFDPQKGCDIEVKNHGSKSSFCL